MARQAGMGNPADRAARLTQTLRWQSDEAVCQTILAGLDEYVAAQMAGRDYLAEFPAIAAHLDACEQCADAYARLYAVETALATDSLPQPDTLPDPDLSFLLPGAAGPLTPHEVRVRLALHALAAQVEAAVRRLGDRLVLQLTPDLAALLRPAPQTVALRAAAQRYGEALLALEPDDTLRRHWPATVTAFRDTQHPDACLVEVVVEPPGRSWPDLEGISVTLDVAGERHVAATDAWGLAAFEGIPIAHLPTLSVEIQDRPQPG